MPATGRASAPKTRPAIEQRDPGSELPPDSPTRSGGKMNPAVKRSARTKGRGDRNSERHIAHRLLISQKWSDTVLSSFLSALAAINMAAHSHGHFGLLE